MQSTLYVSTRTFPSDGTVEIDGILAVSRARNLSLDLTGGLIATPTHYAQMLEGPATALEEVMSSIRRDGRHTDLRFATLAPRPQRDLARWSLAYIGDSGYVSDLMSAVMTDGDQRSFEAIRALMLMFA
jgi:hypothetical protein